MTDVLIVEDNLELGTLLVDFLRRERLSAELCQSGEDGLERLESHKYRMVLLDVMLPGLNGFESCSLIRSKLNIPVLMMSARTDEESKLSGYQTGADDYIEKPFSVPVLTAKIKALIRRSRSEDKQEISVCGISLDPASRSVTRNGEKVIITGKTFDILHYLMKHKGEVVQKDTLFDEIWGTDCFSEPATINVHIRWLREKLEEDPKNPQIIKTVWKVGYILGEGQ